MTFKLIKAGVAALALLAMPFAAEAADMPIKTPYYKGSPRSVIAYYNWTGFYAGLNFGYGFGTSNWDFPAVSVKPKGMMVGGTLGYNWQAGAIVYGIEGDLDWADVKGSATCLAGTLTCETKNDWLGTARVRLGYAFDRWLPYVTGGGAFGNVKATATPAALGGSANKTQIGWTFGAGLEYAFMGNWSAKLEYLYVDLGKFDTGFTTPVADNVTFKENIIRAGINYKFAGPIFSRF
jgi:outer membrane immunogenic protein